MVNFIVSWIFTIVLSLRFRKTFNKTQKLSTYIVFILYLLSFIPTMTLCSYGNYSLKFTVLVSVYWTIIILLEYYFCAQKNRGYSNKSQTLIKSKTKNNLLTSILSVVVACCILGFSYYYKGFQINLNLDDVYVLRYGEIRSLSGVLQYVYLWVGIFAAVLCVRSFINKKYPQFIIWLILLALYYSIEGNKIILFIVPVSILAIIFKLKDNMWLIPLAFIALNFCVTFEPFVNGLSYFNGFWGLRTLYLPADLTHKYYEYFSVNGPDYWARSFMRHFGAVSKYDLDFGHIIDIAIYGASGEGNSNTGLFGSAYANWGDLCIIIYPIIMLLVFAFINWFTKAVPVKHCYILLIYYSYVLLNCDPFITLMTNGLIIVGLIFRLVLFPKKKASKIRKRKGELPQCESIKSSY